MNPVKKIVQNNIDYRTHKLGCQAIKIQVRDQASFQMTDDVWSIVWDVTRYETVARLLWQR